MTDPRPAPTSDFCTTCDTHLSEFCWVCHGRVEKQRDDARAEVDRLRAEAKRADEEATKLATSDLATTEQVIRALRAENERLREACALALNVMEQKNKVNIPPMAKFITIEFASEDIAVLRAALEAVNTNSTTPRPCAG